MNARPPDTRPRRGLAELGKSLGPGPLLTALQFLTILPSPVRHLPGPADLGRAVGLFPVVGLGIGGVLVGTDWVLGRVLPVELRAVLTLAVWVALSGAIHLDGFLDSCDGLLGGHTPEARMRIMRDHCIGSFAAAGAVLLLMAKWTAIVAVPHRTGALLLAPMMGRWTLAAAVVAFPYGRPEGAGRVMHDNAGWPQLALATVFGMGAAVLVGGWQGLAGLLLVTATTYLAARFALARLPGLTGDVYGAVCELGEVVFLILLVGWPSP